MHCQRAVFLFWEGLGWGGGVWVATLVSRKKKKQQSGGEISYTYSYFENAYKNDDIMVSQSVLFLPARVCVVFISVIVTHPSFVHGESIRAHEKWLTAVMSVSPPSAYHSSSATWNTDSPFIPLQCFPSASYSFLPSHFHRTNPPFWVEAGLILVDRTGPGHRISNTGGGAVGVG